MCYALKRGFGGSYMRFGRPSQAGLSTYPWSLARFEGLESSSVVPAGFHSTPCTDSSSGPLLDLFLPLWAPLVLSFPFLFVVLDCLSPSSPFIIILLHPFPPCCSLFLLHRVSSSLYF